MVIVDFGPNLKRTLKRMKNKSIKSHVKKQIQKIIENPKSGKPMKYGRKGTREVYVQPYRLSYMYIASQNKIIFLDH